MAKRPWNYWTLLILFLYSVPSNANDLKEIVVLNSYHSDYKWASDLNQAITNFYAQKETTRLFYDYMDSKHFSNEDYFIALKQTLQLKYNNHQIDGIICADNKAFDFFIEHGKSIWGDIPAVFCGVNNIDEYMHLVDSTKHSVVAENIDIKATLDLISELQPQLDEIIVVTDQTLSGKIFMRQFEDAMEKYHKNIKYKELDTGDPYKFKSELNNLPAENKAIYLLSIYTNRNGVPNELMKEKHYFFDKIKIPMYSNWDFLMPDYIVGGRILKAGDQGRLSAQLLLSKLNGEPTALITIPDQTYTLDHVMLKKHGLSTPHSFNDVQIINVPITFVSQFKNELIFIFVILISLLIVIILLVSDMIKRKKVELELVKSEKRLELAVDGAGEGLWDVDLTTGSIYFNDHFAVLLGYQYGDELKINAGNWQDITYYQDREQMKEAYNLHKTGKADAFKCEIRLLKKNEQISWFSIHGKITECHNDTPLRITGVIQNIDGQKDFENQLKFAKHKAEESDKLKSSFLANMSHEIRTPMNAILGFTDLLIESDMNEYERGEYLSFVKKSGENLLTLINDIIDISKIESGQLQIKLSNCNLNSMLKDLVAVGNTLINSQNKAIQLKLLPIDINEAFHINTDQLRLYQILLNLISNAIKFTEEGSVKINYTVLNDINLEISVKDTGPGISESDLKIIFDRFRQIDESTIKKHGGTGLGLSITKSLVELMNGSIEVITKPGEGAEFKVILPCLVPYPNS